MPKESGLSLMAVNPTYAFFSLDATGEIFLLLIEFTHNKFTTGVENQVNGGSKHNDSNLLQKRQVLK